MYPTHLDRILTTSFPIATILEGELPIQPQVTPGWGVSGVLLLLTGAVYTLLGIKNARVHTFFSAAYLASLATTVLIVYVMTLPVSDTIQGAYVVAVAMTGIILGGAATIFKEVTEGLGCMLGGFCLSMWLLCLQEGGLLQGTAAKVIFIACFTLCGFAFYFSRYTRDYALIGMISFGGATVTVLGVDCFSRAGLKEFWAYIWGLNENLFPLGVNTYPLTKGIRVEIAAIVIIFLAGIVSQMKLWRIIKARREKRDAERAAGERDLQREEESVGRQVEGINSRERRQWERAFGEGDGRSVIGSADSGVGDMEMEKKLHYSNGLSSGPHSPRDIIVETMELPMDDSPPAVPPKSPPPPQGLVSKHDGNGMVTVRVARDDLTAKQEVSQEEGPRTWILGPDGEVRPASRVYREDYSRSSAASPTPAVVPLPFRVPAEDGVDDDKSSVAAFAADDGETPIPSKRNSMVNRLSQGSINLLRSFSQRSSGVDGPKRRNTGSCEDLVRPKSNRFDEDNGSIAATIDNESLDDETSTIRDMESPESIEIKAALASSTDATPKRESTRQESKVPEPAIIPKEAEHQDQPAPANVASESVVDNVSDVNQVSDKPVPAESSEASDITPAEDNKPSENGTEAQKAKAKSVASVDSTPVSLTKDRLPRTLSRVAMSYRTNEWAKHLSNAETPEPDTLQISDYVESDEEKPYKEESSVPLDVEDLQLTAENATPAPAPVTRRNSTSMSNYAGARSVSRAMSRQSVLSTAPGSLALDLQGRDSPNGMNYSNNTSSGNRISSALGLRRTGSGLPVHPIVEERDEDESSTRASPTPGESISARVSRANSSSSSVPGEPMVRPPVPGVVSYSSPQTLIGKREMLLRHKAQSPYPPAPTPDLYQPQRPPSEVGSVYNYNAYSGHQNPIIPDDDMPMSQRREIMRHNSMLSLTSSQSMGPRPTSVMGGPSLSAESLPFNSHQPQRHSKLPSQAVRDAQLANFRQSVAADLRAGTPVAGMASNGRETPLPSHNGPHYSLVPGQYNRELEVQRSIDTQRSVLLSQKEAEAQRRESQRWEKEMGDRAFEERMRRGDMLEAHREAMRKLQGGARHA
jgi:hypothetical protein